MKTRIASIINNKFTVASLLIALVGSALQVTPAYAASIVVNTSADNYANDGKCTLREAIDAANLDQKSGTVVGECAAGSASGVDAISFDAKFAPYVITVGSGGTNPKQLPYIISAVQITGLGSANTIIQAADKPNTATWRIFQVTPGSKLTLDGVTIRNGQCQDNNDPTNPCKTLGGVEANAGGGIHNSGTLTVRNSTISGNRGTLGGGIYNAVTVTNIGTVIGTLTIDNTQFLDNHAFRVLGAEDGGGAIYNSGTMTVTNSTLSTNQAEKNGGAIFSAAGSTANLINSTISGNTGVLGGGIFNSGGEMTVTGSKILGNTALQGGSDDGGGGIRNAGLLTVISSEFSGNKAPGGSGILNFGTLTLKDSTIAGNTADYGAGILNSSCLKNCPNQVKIVNTIFKDNNATQQAGAMYSHGNNQVVVTDSTFLNNNADNGGGAILSYGAQMTITGSIFSGNTSPRGGGIYNSSGPMTLVNSTFFNNHAYNNTYPTPLEGGAIKNLESATLTVTNSTFAGNAAAKGGAIYNESTQNPATTTLRNTIIANSLSGQNCFGTIDNGGYNLDSSSSCSWGSNNGSQSNTDPMLGPLANNGGPTQTMKLQPGSAALDAIPVVNGSCNDTGVINDQRGLKRTPDNHCDIGAYEHRLKNGGINTTGVFRPSNGLLYLKNSNSTGFADVAINYGISSDYPVVGDWDGNGSATIGVYRNGKFYLRNTNTVGFADLVFAFGQPGDQPVAGDWDGDGIDTIGIYRSSTGQFFLRNSNSAGNADTSFYLGIPGDVAIAGDWSGNGFDTTGVFRPSNGVIFLKNSNTSGFADIALNYGISGDKPVTGDWDGNGTDTIGVLRGNIFYLRNSNTVGFADFSFALGIPGDMPIAGNWIGVP